MLEGMKSVVMGVRPLESGAGERGFWAWASSAAKAGVLEEDMLVVLGWKQSTASAYSEYSVVQLPYQS